MTERIRIQGDTVRKEIGRFSMKETGDTLIDTLKAFNFRASDGKLTKVIERLEKEGGLEIHPGFE